MEEIRYKLESYNEAFCEIHDTEKNKWYIRKDLVTNLLNQQDKEIKHITKLYYELNNKYCKELDKLINMQEENGYIIFSDGYDENGNEVHKQEFVKYKDKFNELVEENKKLKQSQKQIIISILEDIMTHCRYGISDYWSLHCVCTIIENKIKELEKKE